MTTSQSAPDQRPAPDQNEYAPYYHQYISKVPEGEFLAVFAKQPETLQQLFGDLPGGEDSKLHEPYTWTMKQVLGHLIDVERIFSTRMLHIGVGDQQALPGMDHNIYVDSFDYEPVSMQTLLNEFAALRKANVILAQRMSPASLERVGIASDNSVSARANLFILCGHVVYHEEIVRKRLAT